MILQLKIVGVLLIVLALVHIVFYKYFKWKTELSTINLLNRQLMYVHTFFIALVVLLMGILCVVSATDIAETALGNNISLGLFIFWVIRLVIQFVGYSASHWKGKRLETTIHIFFIFLFSYVSGVFLLVFINSI